MYPWLAIALAFIAFAQSSFGGISDTIVVNFRQNAETNFVPGNPPGFQDIPMVSLCGDAHYHNPWEVMASSVVRSPQWDRSIRMPSRFISRTASTPK